MHQITVSEKTPRRCFTTAAAEGNTQKSFGRAQIAESGQEKLNQIRYISAFGAHCCICSNPLPFLFLAFERREKHKKAAHSSIGDDAAGSRSWERRAVVFSSPPSPLFLDEQGKNGEGELALE